MIAHDILGKIPHPPRFVIFSSYGNDSVALIQWAADQGLRDVVVVYSETGWAAKLWSERVERLEWWVHTLGFWTDRTTSMGFEELAFRKKGFPTQRYQWCSYHLKIEPAERWLVENDPDGRAICLIGVRREEGPDRADFPQFLLASNSHGGRVMIAPGATWDETCRNSFLAKAGVEPLPHRSMECSPCINSNRDDLLALSADDEAKAAMLEQKLTAKCGLTRNGKPRTMFRPHRHMGAVGVTEVMKWARAGRGNYRPPETDENFYEDAAEKEDRELGSSGCDAAYCGN